LKTRNCHLSLYVIDPNYAASLV